jgi:hypothetical protein
MPTREEQKIYRMAAADPDLIEAALLRLQNRALRSELTKD